MSKTDFTAAAKAEIRRRSKGACEVQETNCWHRATLFHHILRRGVGGKGTADNGLHLCVPCHQFVHEHVAESYERGWLRRSGSVVVDIGGGRVER